MKWIVLILLLILNWGASGAVSNRSESVEMITPNRPEWLQGVWRSDPHSLDLGADGSCSCSFFATLSGELDKFYLGASGKHVWSAEARDQNGTLFWLKGIANGYQVRRGRTNGVIYLTDPISHWEVPFYRVDKDAGGKISEALDKIEKAEKAASVGDRRQAEVEFVSALKHLRELSDPCPVLTARAGFRLGQVLEQGGQPQKAILFYNYCIQLRERAFETPHPDLTRAYFFAGRCMDRASGYDRALWYLVRAALVQRQVMARMETVGGTPVPVLKATRDETAAVYMECARVLSSYGYTPGVVALYPAAIRLALANGNRPYARAAPVQLFSHLLSRPNNHDHSALLLSVAHYLEVLDSREALVRRTDLPGMILQAVRVAQEMPAMKPPRPDLAKRFALRAVAMQRIGDVKEPPYIGRQVLPEMVNATAISNEVANLKLPGDDFWPAGQAVIARSELWRALDAASAPVDLRAEFPMLHLGLETVASDSDALGRVDAQLQTMLPTLLEISKRPAAAQVEADVRQYLEPHQ